MAESTPKPIAPSEFAALLTACPALTGVRHLAVAVSGGADSMALALLAAEWARSTAARLTALTVDHGLRTEAATEAKQVGAWLRSRGIAHEILKWRGEKPSSNVQALARRARYGLLDEWCLSHGADVLLLAHHLEDQAETVLLRLGRGSGVYGLAGMSPESKPAWPGAPAHLRPLLRVPKARLRATLEDVGQPWVDDPSNEDAAFSRVRARRLWPQLETIGITPERLAQTAAHLRRAREALDADADRLLERACRVYGAGYATVDRSLLQAAHREIGLRAFSRVIQAVGGGDYGPRFASLERLFDGLVAGTKDGGATLAGCRFLPVRDGLFLVAREPRAMEGALSLHRGRQIWDGRYLVTAPRSSRGLKVARIGRDGLREVRENIDSKTVSRIPALARRVLPGIFDDRGLALVPALHYTRPEDKAGNVAIDYLPRYTLPAAAFRE